jgi:hypothetical protein
MHPRLGASYVFYNGPYKCAMLASLRHLRRMKVLVYHNLMCQHHYPGLYQDAMNFPGRKPVDTATDVVTLRKP